MKSSALGIAALGIALSGCATITRGTTQSVAISTPPVTGAICDLTSSQGSWQILTPGAITLEKSSQDLQCRCHKEGYQDAVAVIPSNFEGWTVGNLVFGGIIGVGVDAATGAMNKYPASFQVPMTPLASGQGTSNEPAPKDGKSGK
ncbi:MAG: hypothetical protein SGJ03_06150 [Alphaproteobacteria bacterium]|nr:hypothetical protein [Alphaproteobacteria bacterium]